MNILITGAFGDIGNYVYTILSERYPKAQIIQSDMLSGKVGIGIPSPDPHDHIKYIEFLKTAIGSYNIKYVFPCTEPEIIFFDRNRKICSELGLTVFINNSKIISQFMDKWFTHAALIDLNIATPFTSISQTRLPEYPFIVKPRISRGGKGVKVIEDRYDLDKVFHNIYISRYIIQAIVGSPESEYTTAVFAHQDMCFSITFKRLLSQEYGGYTRFVKWEYNDYIKQFNEIAHKIATAFKLDGCLNFQSRIHNDEIYVFEVNPRISGTCMFRHQIGFQDVLWWLQSKTQDEIDTIEIDQSKQTGMTMLSQKWLL